MEQFVSDLRDIVLGIAHIIMWIIRAIAAVFHAIAWIAEHVLWILGGAALVFIIGAAFTYLPPLLEGLDLSMLKRKQKTKATAEVATKDGAGIPPSQRSEAQRAADDIVWAVRNGDVALVNTMLERLTSALDLTAEITDTQTNTQTITVKRKLKPL